MGSRDKGGKPFLDKAPRTGTGKKGGHGPKPTKNAITQRNKNGGIIQSVTKLLWRGGN